MLAKDMFALRDTLRDQKIMFCYSGYMTEEILLGIGNAVKTQMALDAADSKLTKSVFSVFVEQVQNVIRYSAEKIGTDDSSELRYGLLTVGTTGGEPFVSCGNMIEAKDAERLKDALTHIQSLDKEGLKNLWKDTLRGETPEGSKGAGVGFVDIARRARGGIDFDFYQIDADFFFFTLKAIL